MMKLFIKTTSIILVFLFVSGALLLFLSPRPPLLEGLSFSSAVYDDNHHLLRLTLNKEDKYRLFTPLQAIPPRLISASLLQEDRYFWWHYGVNPFAIVHALYETYVKKSRRMGASTISMQLARLRFGIYSKQWIGKCVQIFRAMQLERHYSKKELLEAYFNLAPYGGNIEGVAAASLVYFHKPIGQTNLAQLLTLSIIPQNPTKRSASNPQLKHIRERLFVRWLKEHPDDKTESASFKLPLQLYSVQQLPFIAPHFVNDILKANTPKTHSIETSLNLSLQTLLEKITRDYLRRKKILRVNNAAVLLLDSRDMSIKALVGSADFFNASISGQINGTNIKRSPGSTLKPFIYGLALDQGLIHPNTVLKDVPHQFGSYNPDNFDYDFMGPIKARDALILSRNIPALHLAKQLTGFNLYQLLVAAGISQLKAESYYGLALALGGSEISMKELASLYAMLVNHGLWQPLRSRLDEKSTISKRLLSPEASFLVLDMLKESTPPTGCLSNGQTQHRASWKTGTSSAYRDAWTIGVFGPYVLSVWVGNFDNKNNPALVGKTMAAPLFFELMHAISHETTAQNPIKSSKALNLIRIPVCKASGLLPTRYCHETETSWFIPGKSPIKKDTVFREVAINRQTGLRTCHFDENTGFAIYEFWPSDLLTVFKQAGIQRRSPPFFEKGCSFANYNGLKPQIVSPQSDLHYILRSKSAASHQIPLIAVTDGGIKHVFWFINETFLAKTRPDKPYFWSAKPGKYVIRVVDDNGLSDAQDMSIDNLNS